MGALFSERDWDAKFEKFHAANPQVFRLFARLAREAHGKGKKAGARCIGEQIRWHYEIRLNTTNSPKFDNCLWPRYARLLAQKDDRFREFFDFRSKA